MDDYKYEVKIEYENETRCHFVKDIFDINSIVQREPLKKTFFGCLKLNTSGTIKNIYYRERNSKCFFKYDLSNA